MDNVKAFRKSIIFVVVMAVICFAFAGVVTIAAPASEIGDAGISVIEITTLDTDTPAVYMTTDISSDGLMALYEALDASPSGNIAVKLSTGEPPNSNYLRTELIGDLVQSLNATIVECNTAYGGRRSSTATHKQVAADHGYTAIAKVDIMDENGSMTLPVTGGSNLTGNYVGANFANYNYFVVLSHFKGHAMAGYGGAIKNISIGIASSQGKRHIHTAGRGGSMWSAPQDPFLESMAEAGKSVVDALDGNILYINVMNRLSVDCDCDGNPSQPDMHDIGILASYDPVALDQACIDLIYAQKDGDGASLVRRIERQNGLHTLEHAVKIGLGSRSYQLVDIDAEQPPEIPTTEPTERPNQSVTMSYENGILTISGLETDAVLIHASYSDIILTNVEILDAKTQPISAKSGDKFFLWSSTNDMFPFCGAVTV